jgi:hypothetical protein
MKRLAAGAAIALLCGFVLVMLRGCRGVPVERDLPAV